MRLYVTKGGTTGRASRATSPILVNNAAVFLNGEWRGNNVETVPMQPLRATFDTNYFGTV